MELEILLNEESTLNKKISKALIEVKEWFEKKIEEVKEIFSRIKEKFLNAIKKYDTRYGVSKDVVDENGKKILSKGDSLKEAINICKKMLVSVKTSSEKVIKDCKYGISNIHDKYKALSTKDKVKLGLKSIIVSVTLIVTINKSISVISNVKNDIDADYRHYKVVKRSNNIDKKLDNSDKIYDHYNRYDTATMYDRVIANIRTSDTELQQKIKDSDYIEKLRQRAYDNSERNIKAKELEELKFKSYLKSKLKK